MAEKKQTVPFQGTKEQEAALKKVIADLQDDRGKLMPILQTRPGFPWRRFTGWRRFTPNLA